MRLYYLEPTWHLYAGQHPPPADRYTHPRTTRSEKPIPPNAHTTHSYSTRAPIEQHNRARSSNNANRTTSSTINIETAHSTNPTEQRSDNRTLMHRWNPLYYNFAISWARFEPTARPHTPTVSNVPAASHVQQFPTPQTLRALQQLHTLHTLHTLQQLHTLQSLLTLHECRTFRTFRKP